MTRRRRWLAGALAGTAGVAAALAWVAAAPAAVPHDTAGRASPADQPAARFFADGGQFVVDCAPARTAADDPIVHPGDPEAAHLHEFFGSTAVDAHSTGASLLGTPTSCETGADTASYWVPALLRDGERVAPTGMTAYYRVAPGVDPADVEPLPLGLAAVAGDRADPAVAGWGCGRGPSVTVEPPSCPASAPLGLRVTFPDCWDGRRLDSADHRSHLAYSGPAGCEASHPVGLPRLTVVVHYGIHGDPAGLSLSSGAASSVHADLLNGWDPTELARKVRACLHRGVVCGIPESSRAAAP